jgi:D-alanyl-D-alanine carboxypeptidase/D-alanyl-D-alanine-endopeptidase (penicillin-binding protein 4)
MRAAFVALLLLPIRLQDAEQKVRDLLRRHKLSEARFGIVVQTTRGRKLIEINADKPLIPASNMKIVTTAAALDRLGAGFEFSTRLYAQGRDLVILAGGDPNISARDHGGDPAFLFKRWADKLKKAGIESVGDVRLVNSIFDTDFIHPDWRDQDLTRWYAAPVGAFSLNDNCVDLSIVSEGGKIRISTVPPARAISIRNELSASAKPEKPIRIRRKGWEITVSGDFPNQGSREDNCAVENPHDYFATVLIETLRAGGIEVRGRAIEINEKVALAPQGAPVDEFRSPIGRTLEICNGNSQNFYAEMLLKQMGYRASGWGTFESGAGAVTEFLKKRGIEGAKIADGSGLSRENRLSAETIVKILAEMADRREFVESLAVSGRSGTLQKRLKTLEGKVRAKTGHISGVNAISGYLTAASGETILFSILSNDPSCSNGAVDDLCELIHGSF